MHSGAGLLGTQMRRYLNPQQTRESDSWRLVHERHGHLNFHAVHLPYWFPRSSALHQLTTATSNASMASFLRLSSGKISAGHGWTTKYRLSPSYISDTDTSSIPKSHLHTHASNVIRDSHRHMQKSGQGRNGKSPTTASTPQQPGLPQVECAAKALIRYSDGTTFSSSSGIIGIMGLSCLLPLVSPCPDGLVLAARSDHLAIGSPGDGIDLGGPVSACFFSDWFAMHVVTYLVLVAWKIHGHVSCPHVPDFECGVLAACDQEPAVRAPGALVDLCGGVRLGGSMEA